MTLRDFIKELQKQGEINAAMDNDITSIGVGQDQNSSFYSIVTENMSYSEAIRSGKTNERKETRLIIPYLKFDL